MIDERSFVLGVIAGCGKFSFVHNKSRIYPKFIVQVMLKDAELLFKIKKYLAIGHISINSNNTAYFEVRNKKECQYLTTLIGTGLNFLPQYIAWKQAVYFININDEIQAKAFVNTMKDISLAQNENVLKLRARINKMANDIPTTSLLNSII